MVKLKELREALQSNDPLLIEEIYERIYDDYYKLVYYIVIKIVKDTEDCIEITNDVFLKAFNNISKFDINNNQSSIKSWIVRIAKNEAINFYNKQKKHNIVLDDEYIEKIDSPDIDKFLLLVESINFFTEVIIFNLGLADAIAESKSRPLELKPKTLTYGAFLLLVEEFKEILTEEELDILMFRIYYDLKLREIAEYYNSTTSVIYTKYQNALKVLKEHYKKGDFHE